MYSLGITSVASPYSAAVAAGLARGLALADAVARARRFVHEAIRTNPGLWMWAYKHFRYRPRDPTAPYPFYANQRDAFDRLRSIVDPERNGV